MKENLMEPRTGVIDAAEIERRFSSHPTDTKVSAEVRTAFIEFAQRLAAILPEGRDKSLVFSHLEDAGFRAQASIARAPGQTAFPAMPNYGEAGGPKGAANGS